ncbi:MAG: hypothetical protein WEA31_03215, partial [Pirellulales bacterium]
TGQRNSRKLKSTCAESTIDSSSNSLQDLKRRWIFCQAEDQSLDRWLTLLHYDGVRDLMRMGRETARLRIIESKKAYLSHTRKFFDAGENAFTLLNRAAGLKQLNSIDEIFRDLVLDDRSAFDRALEVAGEFDNLAEIHAELETARRQQESLAPVAEEHYKLEKSRVQVRQLETLKRIVPVWFAIAGERLWAQVLNTIAVEKKAAESQLNSVRQKELDLQSRVSTLHEQYLNLGGNVIGELENTIQTQRDLVVERKKHADDYRRMVNSFGLGDELCEAALQRNQAALRERRGKIQQQRDTKQEETLTALSQKRDQEAKAGDVASSLRKVEERPGSNIPPQFQDFRAELANQLGTPDNELPFLAELVEVKSDETAWRGAIERAIGSERLRILVADNRLSEALRWINHRDNHLHVRLQRASHGDQPGQFFPDGFSRKLNFKPHPLLLTAKQLLASR